MNVLEKERAERVHTNIQYLAFLSFSCAADVHPLVAWISNSPIYIYNQYITHKRDDQSRATLNGTKGDHVLGWGPSYHPMSSSERQPEQNKEREREIERL